MRNPTPLRTFVALLLGLGAVTATVAPASGSPKDEQALRDGCTWLDRALTREPERDDAFGMFMRGLMPKCQALLEGLARGDKSVRPEGLKAVINEIAQLQTVIDEEYGGPPPATGRPTPDEAAKKKVADERAGVDAEAQKRAEAERQAAEEARRAEAERKAAEDEAKRKEAEARAAAEAEKRLAEQRAKETEKERKAREAEEKKTEAARKREEERVRKEMAAAEKKAAEDAKRAEAERVKAEKKAAEDARRAEAERLKAEKAAAAGLEREAARQAKEREAEEAEARRLIDEANREGARENARLSAEEDAKRRLADEQAKKAAEEQARRAAEEQAQSQGPKTKTRAKGGALDGTWEQPPGRSLDRNIKRTLNIFTKDGKIQGEVYEEVWYPAPTSWVDRSCEGNSTFRMVTSARVTGEAGKNKLVLWRDVPRVLTCTCPSRCTVETRRRGFDLDVSPDGRELSDSSGVFVRPGTVIVGSARQAESEETPGPVVTATPRSFVGVWETAPFKRRDETVVMRLELSEEGGKLKGMLVERSSQGLPLQSWSERFCGGATRWEWVAKWEIEGDSKGKGLSLRGKGGDNLTCSCPSKCKKPKDKITLSGSLGATGGSLTLGGDLYEKK